MTPGFGRIGRAARAWADGHRATMDNAPGVLGSLALHGLAAAIILLMLLHQVHQPQQTLPHVIPVDLIALGERTTAPPVPAKAPAPQQTARHGPPATPKAEGVRPNGERPPVDPLQARLERLARLRQPDTPVRQATNGAADMTATSQGAAPGPAAYAVRDYIREQVLRRWSLDLAKLGRHRIVIALHISLTPSGRLAHIAIVDQQRYRKDAVFRDIAISARNAVILSAPFKIPPGVARPALEFTMRLDPRDTLR